MDLVFSIPIRNILNEDDGLEWKRFVFDSSPNDDVISLEKKKTTKGKGKMKMKKIKGDDDSESY
jgi:hypothetical protein